MSKQEAIENLQAALRMADLPDCGDKGCEKNGDDIIAANYAFKVGYMSSTIRRALAELGDER